MGIRFVRWSWQACSIWESPKSASKRKPALIGGFSFDRGERRNLKETLYLIR